MNMVCLSTEQVKVILNLMNSMENQSGLLEQEELLRDTLEIAIGDDIENE